MSQPSCLEGTAADRVPVRVPTGGLPGSRLRRVTEYIQDNLRRALSLAELSALVNMSPYHEHAPRRREPDGGL